MRLIVTGSPDWPEQRADAIHAVLTTLLLDEDIKVLTVAHAQGTQGVDLFARHWCDAWGPMAGYLGKDVLEEIFDAAWTTGGPEASSARDQRMVNYGAELCIGFPIDLQTRPSAARDCMAMAEAAGIEVWDMSGLLVPAG